MLTLKRITRKMNVSLCLFEGNCNLCVINVYTTLHLSDKKVYLVNIKGQIRSNL